MVTAGDVWVDIDRINQAAKERLGYPTQKPPRAFGTHHSSIKSPE
jgi:hypothetical protein